MFERHRFDVAQFIKYNIYSYSLNLKTVITYFKYIYQHITIIYSTQNIRYYVSKIATLTFYYIWTIHEV